MNALRQQIFLDRLTAILEPTDSKAFKQRRHQFLDHLLARFSDAYTDVANFQDTDHFWDRKRLQLKEQLLSSYDQLSKQRGKGKGLTMGEHYVG